MRFTLTAVAMASLAAPALAQDAPTGDAEAGVKVFNQCQTCHVIENEAGEVLAGKTARTGPNLYGVPGRVAGSLPDFKYSKSLVALGEKGVKWDEEHFTAFVHDPAKYLKEELGDPKATTKMSFKLKKPEDVANVWAFIVSLSPAPPADGDAVPAAEGTGTETGDGGSGTGSESDSDSGSN